MVWGHWAIMKMQSCFDALLSREETCAIPGFEFHFVP